MKMHQKRQWAVKDDITVTGMSGRLPSSDSIEEFEKNLFSGKDMVTVDAFRWPPGKNHRKIFTTKNANKIIKLFRLSRSA